MKKAFTMIELVVVIVILGILSSVALNTMSVTRDDAYIVKGQAQVSSIRAAIMRIRSKNLMRGMTSGVNPSALDALSTSTSSDGDKLFDFVGTSATAILDNPMRSKSENGWRKTAKNSYTYNANHIDVAFTYTDTDGSFDCTHGTDTEAKKMCDTLTQ